jgi:hypothetical protein
MRWVYTPVDPQRFAASKGLVSSNLTASVPKKWDRRGCSRNGPDHTPRDCAPKRMTIGPIYTLQGVFARVAKRHPFT